MPAGLITAVAPGSLAERVGLRPGDELLSINERALRDVVDVRFYGAEEHLLLRIRRGGEDIDIEVDRRYQEPLGLAFEHPTFDGIRLCDNRCEFCFVSQMPPPERRSSGFRRSLYVKDDDYRYSFLFGNYVTLTNLVESDWARIDEQRLSPLYVSVHATDVDLRRQVLRNPAAPDVMAQLRRLADIGVEVHAQIVVVPGLNDGSQLDRSVGELARLYPSVRSVSVVPVGLTKYHRGECRVHTDAESRTVLEQVGAWQARFQERLGVHFVYLSDEWYLRAGQEVPAAETYDGLDLTENGVGLVRRFLDVEIPLERPGAVTLVTGSLFAPLLGRSVAGFPGVEVVAVLNRFFGESVTVAGLLTGQDVVEQLRRQDLGDLVLLPPAMFGGPEGQSLDAMSPRQVGEALGRRVVVGWGC